MNTKEIEYILSNENVTRKLFTGVYSIDNLINIHKCPKLVICNTDPSNKPGKHWVLFFFHETTVDYFDSLGNTPEHYGVEFIKFMQKFANTYNICYTRVQPIKSLLCGHYCVWFAVKRCNNQDMYEIINTLPEPNLIFKIVSAYLNCFNLKSRSGQNCISQ